MNSPACVYATIVTPQSCLEPPISHQKKTFVRNLGCFSYFIRNPFPIFLLALMRKSKTKLSLYEFSYIRIIYSRNPQKMFRASHFTSKKNFCHEFRIFFILHTISENYSFRFYETIEEKISCMRVCYIRIPLKVFRASHFL